MMIKNRKGFVLIAAFLVVVLLLVLISAYITSTFSESKAARKSQMITTAVFLAEAGVDRTIVDLEGFSGVDLTQQTVGYEIYPQTYFSLGEVGGFERRATISQIVPSGIIVRIESWGHASSASMPVLNTNAPEYQMKYIETFVNVTPSPLFPMALFTQEEIDLNNSIIDSYNSSRGPYGGPNVGNNGDIGSNNAGRERDIIELRGRSTVNGDATVGPSVPWREAIDVDRGAQITGTQSNASKTTTLPLPTIPGGTNSIDLSRVNTAQTYPGGTYSTSSINISAVGSVQFSSPTVLYVTGEVQISGSGGMNSSGNLPANLIVQIVGSGDVKLSGNANFYGGIYAPQSEVEIKGNANVFGAVAAKEADVEGTGARNMGIHYDETLIRVPGGSGYKVTIVAWHDLS